MKLLKSSEKNFISGNPYSTLSCVRAITDHIPPLLGFITFEEVVNSYPWGETDKKYMKALISSRPVSDDVLHRVISNSDDLLDMDNVPNKQFLNRLLQECLEKTVPYGEKRNM